MQHLVAHVVGHEIGHAAAQVHESSGREAALFVENQPDAPAPTLDLLAAAAALGLAARGPLGPVDPGEAVLGQAAAGGALQGLTLGQVHGGFLQGLEKRLRPFVGRAGGMEPEGHLPFAEGVGQALAEAQLSELDEPAAAPALGATARSGFEDVRHAFRPHQGMGFPSRKKPPVGPSSRSAAQRIEAAPSPSERGAPGPPISVRTQPGQTELIFTARPSNSGAMIRTRALSAALETP